MPQTGSPKLYWKRFKTCSSKWHGKLAHDDYEDRRLRQRQGIELPKQAGKYKDRVARTSTHDRIILLRRAGHRIIQTARLAECRLSQVKRIWSKHQKK